LGLADVLSMQEHHEQWLMFEAMAIDADVALLFLRHALNGVDAECALNAALNARRAILDSRHACEQLGEPSYAQARLAELRHSGHGMLAGFLSYACEPIGHAGYKNVGITEQASRVALVALLWKLSDALDRVEQPWVS
jgi:hypothetical protein